MGELMDALKIVNKKAYNSNLKNQPNVLLLTRY